MTGLQSRTRNVRLVSCWLLLTTLAMEASAFMSHSTIAFTDKHAPFTSLHSSVQETETETRINTSAASKTTTTTTTTTPASSKTRKRVRKKKATVRSAGTGKAISKDELVEHVQERYSALPSSYLDTALDKSQKLREEEQDRYTKLLNGCPALVLNADYQPLSYLPLSLWSWQDAIKAIFSGKVTVVDAYPDVSIRAANLEVPLPSVIALNEYVPVGSHRPAFTRRNVFLRDEYTCQYCTKRYHTSDLSLDHVVPRSQGGVLSWENAVTSCLKCNGKKGSTPVSQLRSIGMKLHKEPRCPSQYELATRAAKMVPKRVHSTWKPYLGFTQEDIAEEYEERQKVKKQSGKTKMSDKKP